MLRIFLTIWILLSGLFAPTVAFANTFGDTCSTLPVSDSDGYLTNDTAYGFIKENIDIKTHTENGCDQDGEEFTFCIRNGNTTGAGSVCDVVSLSLGQSVSLDSLTNNVDLTSASFLREILLSVEMFENSICLAMPTSRGKMPLMCRNAETVAEEQEEQAPTCRVAGDSCYEGDSKSQSIFSFSGLTIHCLRDTLDKMFYTINECANTDGEITLTMLRPFAEFQAAMLTAVRAALVIYVIFYGMKVALNYEVATPKEIFTFLLKFILVLYFAVGIWGGAPVDGVEVKRNGMTDFALPFLVDMTSQFTELVFMAAGANGLCDFDPAKYESGFGYYRVWDAIDCRLGFYLGLDLMHNMGPSDMSGSDNLFSPPSADSVISSLTMTGNFAIIYVFFGFFMAAAIPILIILVIFLLVYISMIMYFVTVYLACMVVLYILSYLAPIFVPMMLFQRTKDYFEAWLRMLVSCALQPAVIGGFLAVLLTVFDTAMYGNCVFNRVDYDLLSYSFSTFQIALPVNEIEKCEASVGYKLLRYFSGEGWDSISLIFFSVPRISDFFDILASLVYLSLYLALFYYFIKSASGFASRLVGGPDLSSLTMNPNMLVDKVISIGKAAANIAIALTRLSYGNVSGAIGDTVEAGKEALKDTSGNDGSRSNSPDEGNLVGSNPEASGEGQDKVGKQKEGAKMKLSDLPKALD